MSALVKHPVFRLHYGELLLSALLSVAVAAREEIANAATNRYGRTGAIGPTGNAAPGVVVPHDGTGLVDAPTIHATPQWTR